MTETSRSKLDESISALIDGEGNDMDLQRVLNAMDSDAETRETWARFHQYGAVVRGEEMSAFSMDISQAVRESIENEEVKVSSRVFQGVWNGLGKTAVAASVMVAVVFGVQQYPSNDPAQSEESIAANASSADSSNNTGAVVPHGFELPPLSARTVSTNTFASQDQLPRSPAKVVPQGSVIITNEQFQEQMNRLMFKHAEQSASSSGIGVVPFARVSELGDSKE